MPHDDQAASQASSTRRRFIRFGWMSAIVVVLGGQLWLLLKLFLTPPASGGFGSEVVAGLSERFPVGSVTHFWKERFLLVRHDTGFLALSHQCTHQRCNVDYLAERGVILCPCHGARFDLHGTVLRGPATRPLDRFSTIIREGQVIVDTSYVLRAVRPSG